MPSEIGLALAPDLNPAPDPDLNPDLDLDRGPAQEAETKKTRTPNPEADPKANRKKEVNHAVHHLKSPNNNLVLDLDPAAPRRKRTATNLTKIELLS